MVYNDTVRNITFPGNESVTYTSYWNSREIYRGNTTLLYPVPWTTSPVFIVNGSMVPLRIVTNLTGRGTGHFPKALTIAINRPSSNGQWVRRIVREFKRPGLNLGYRFHSLNDSALLELESSAFTPHSFKKKLNIPSHRQVADRLEHFIYDEIIFSIDGICFENGVSTISVTQNSYDEPQVLNLANNLETISRGVGFFYDEDLQRLIIRPTDSHLGVQLKVKGSLSLCAF